MVLLVITDYSNSVRGSTEMMNNCLPFFLSAKMYTSIYLILFCLGSLSGYLGTVYLNNNNRIIFNIFDIT